MLDYVRKLQTNGRYPLCIWPPHCLLGSSGHNIFPVLFDALREWEERNFATFSIIATSSNLYVEFYSAVKAEVPDPEDPATELNTLLVNRLKACDAVLIAGEPLSFAVANTVRDIANAFGNADHVKKLVLLRDVSSNVAGFEGLGDTFIDDLMERGMRVTTTESFRH